VVSLAGTKALIKIIKRGTITKISDTNVKGIKSTQFLPVLFIPKT
jgi:hypothetical protein